LLGGWETLPTSSEVEPQITTGCGACASGIHLAFQPTPMPNV